MLDPATPEHLLMNQIYTFSTMIQLCLILISLKCRRYQQVSIFLAFVLFVPRQCIRVLDLEGTNGTMLSREDFGFLSIAQLTGSFGSLLIYANTFQQGAHHKVFAVVCTIFIFYCMRVSIYGFEDFLFHLCLTLHNGFLQCLFVFTCFLFNRESCLVA